MNDCLAAALTYAARGWAVFPVVGKVPLTEHGFKDASTDSEQLAGLFSENGTRAGVAIRTGAVSGLVVLDVDTPKGGAGTLAQLEKQHGKLPPTFEVLTGGGGRHYFFRHPGQPVRNSASAVLGHGLDIRADGGYVVAPPSPHESGRPYKLLHDRDPAELPSWLLSRLTDARPGLAAPIGERIPEGARNVTLASLAGTMRRRGASENEIRAALEIANRDRCSPPLDDDEVARIAESVSRYPAAAPPRPGPPPVVPQGEDPERAPEPEAEAEEPKAQLEPYAALDLAAFLSTPPAEPEWDWHGWYARGDVVLEAGDPGAGKSMLALARSVMAAQAGGELLGENIAARRVLFLDLESPDDVVYQRLYAFGLRGSVDGFAYIHRPDYLNLLDSESLARLRATIVETQAGLVVIDSLRRAAPGLDENDSRQVSIIFSALRNLAREFGCTIIVIHHPRKPVGDAKIEALYAARGSGDLTGSVDSYIFYRRLSDGLIRLEHGKARRGREHEHDHFRIVETDDGLPAVEHVIPQRVDENELDTRVLDHVTEHPGNPQNKIEGSVKGGRGSVRKSLERLATHKLIAQGPGRHPAGKYWYPANHAALSVASDAQATLGEMSPGLSQGQVVAVSPPALKGGDTSGDTLDGEEPEAEDDFS